MSLWAMSASRVIGGLGMDTYARQSDVLICVSSGKTRQTIIQSANHLLVEFRRCHRKRRMVHRSTGEDVLGRFAE